MNELWEVNPRLATLGNIVSACLHRSQPSKSFDLINALAVVDRIQLNVEPKFRCTLETDVETNPAGGRSR
jgi:hypothetical protein